MHTTPIQNILRSLPLVAKAVLLFSVVLYTTGIGTLSTLGAWSATASIPGNSVSTGVWAQPEDISETIIVTPSDMQGWIFAPENTPLGGQIGQMATGPATPPLGDGSAQFVLTANNESEILVTEAFKGTALADIIELSYQTYRTTGNAAQAPALSFEFDNDVTDLDNGWRGRMVYEPYHTQTVTGDWEEWDTLNDAAGTGTGNWWGSSNALSTLDDLCPQSNPCTWSEVKAHFPDAGIRNAGAGTGLLLFKAGSGWNGFDGNVDEFIIGIQNGLDTQTYTYDFEPDPVIPPPPAPTYGDIEDFVVFGAGNVSDVHAVTADGNFTVYSGLVGSNRSVTINGNHTVPGVRAGAHVTLNGNGAIDTAGVRANGTISKNGNVTITGPEVTGSGSFDTLELPDANGFVANGADQSVGGNGTLTLAPGVYGTMIGGGNATLELSAGEYVFKSISMTGNTDVVFDTTMGPIEIYVAETVDLEGEIFLTETVSTASAKIYLEAGEVISFGANATWYGTAYSTMNRNPALPGITAAGNIEVFGALYSNQQVKFNGNADLTLVGPYFGTYEGPAPVTIEDVVLNEIYPAPLTSGNPIAPYDREWIEIYNGSDVAVDIEGWKVSEIAGPEVKHTISTTNTCADGSKVGYARPFDGASTVIAPGGLLVVEFCAETRLNQSGSGTVETVRLYTSADTLLDTHGYAATVAGKSHQRIPDGGIWVDPEPTPGESNRVSREDLVSEGFTDEQIEYIIALLARRGEYLIGEEPVEEEPIAETTIEELLPEVPTETTPTSGGSGGSSPATIATNPEDGEIEPPVDNDTTPPEDDTDGAAKAIEPVQTPGVEVVTTEPTQEPEPEVVTPPAAEEAPSLKPEAKEETPEPEEPEAEEEVEEKEEKEETSAG